MENLVDFYNDLKSQMDPKSQDTEIQNRSKEVWRNNMVTKRDNLVEDCAKRIIIDIYHHTLPLDDQYKDCNQQMVSDDVGSMLDKKNMTPMQYFKSAYEKTHAPLLEFVIRSINEIGRQYQEDATEDMKDKEEKGLPLVAVDPNEDKVDSQLLEIKGDSEYEAFMDALKQKTINKIVSDVSSLIDDKKETGDMEFNSDDSSNDNEPALESVVVNAVNYLARQKLIMEAAVEKNNFNGENLANIPGSIDRVPFGMPTASLDDVDIAKADTSTMSLVDPGKIYKSDNGVLIFPTNEIGGELSKVIAVIRNVFGSTMIHVYDSNKTEYDPIVTGVAIGLNGIRENDGSILLYKDGYPRITVDLISTISVPATQDTEDLFSKYLNAVCAKFNEDVSTKYGVKALHWTTPQPDTTTHTTLFAFNEENEKRALELLQKELPDETKKSWIRRLLDKILGRSELTQDQQIGAAVREATMVEMERAFNQINDRNYKTYLEHLSHGNGYVIHR
mgnify:CR=1 FL=1